MTTNTNTRGRRAFGRLADAQARDLHTPAGDAATPPQSDGEPIPQPNKEPHVGGVAGDFSFPRFVLASRVAAQLGVPLDALYRASDRGEFARYYLFGKRKYYLPDEVAEAIKTVVPGDPSRWRRVVMAADAAAPARAGRRRREAPSPARGSSGPTS